jgi:pilus assembly protein Flp/PilA
MKYQVKEFLRRILTKENNGQTLIEYALIVVLIAIVVIVVLTAMGVDITDVYTTIRTTFSGAAS